AGTPGGGPTPPSCPTSTAPAAWDRRMDPVDPLDTLLHQLSGGDAEAAQRVFLAYEPYLRMVVRRQLTPALRARFDSLDIVQSVWADLLTGFQAGRWRFTSPGQLRAFLVKVPRN